MTLLRPTCAFLLLLSLLFGAAYPFVTTRLTQTLFPAETAGSLLVGKKGVALGSALIGQNFTQPGYFWGRLSATTPNAYNASASAGSNYSNTNPALLEAARIRIAALKAADPATMAPIPVDLVTASASGLDPHISIAAAHYQVARVAKARGLSAVQVSRLVEQQTEGRQFGVLGEPRVNVLKLNMALDGI